MADNEVFRTEGRVLFVDTGTAMLPTWLAVYFRWRVILARLEASTCVSRFLAPQCTPQVGERTEFVQDSRRELVLPAAIRLIRLAGSRGCMCNDEAPKTALVRLRPVPSYCELLVVYARQTETFDTTAATR